MQFRCIAAAVIILGTYFWSSNASAGDIEAGTFSVRASSNAGFYLIDHDDGHYRQLYLNTGVGYFFLKNWEAGAEFAMNFGKSSDSSSQSYSLLPYLEYHCSLTARSAFYGRIGAGYGFGYNDSDSEDSDSEFITVFAELGYEYFLTENVSFGVGIHGEHSEYETDYDEQNYEDDDTLKELSTRFSFKLYF